MMSASSGRWAALSLLLPALLCSCATTDLVTGRQTRNIYGIKEDIQIGREGIKDFLREMKEDGARVVRDPARLGRVEAIVRHLGQANRLTNFPYRVTVFETEEINAMALPGGEVVALTGLWDPDEGMVKDADELAAVLAHEIAHVECRHSTEAMTREMPMELLLGGVGLYAELAEDEDLMTIAAAAFVIYEGLVIPKYSRSDELEADRVGLMYMARAGYDPQAALRIWKRLDEVEGGGWTPLSIFSTHPPHSLRYKELEPLLPAALEEFRRVRATIGAPPGELPGQGGGKGRLRKTAGSPTSGGKPKKR
jgi:predicted Zn-dependent protease